jgi:hypothetical protein
MEIRRVSIHSFIRGESGVASGEDWGPLRTVDLLITASQGPVSLSAHSRPSRGAGGKNVENVSKCCSTTDLEQIDGPHMCKRRSIEWVDRKWSSNVPSSVACQSIYVVIIVI